MLARVYSRFAGWVAEIGPRAFAHRLTHRTQVVVTFREAHTHAHAHRELRGAVSDASDTPGYPQGLKKLDTLGGKSHHPVHPFAAVVVRQHHVKAELLSRP